MKRKRKAKEDYFFDIVIEMAWHGFSRGMAFGALYGVLLFLMWERIPDYRAFAGLLVLATIFGLPLGAFFGVIAGLILGILNGLLIGILIRLSFLSVQDWDLYPSRLAMFCGLATLVVGVLLFQAVYLPLVANGFFAFVVAPALIAAIVLAHGSQHAADRYIEATYSAE